jgi:hypothetical protein
MTVESARDRNEEALLHAVALECRVDEMRHAAAAAWYAGDEAEKARCELDIDFLQLEAEELMETIATLTVWNTSGEGLTNIAVEMTDQAGEDKPGDRWGHMLDNYLEEQQAAELLCRPRKADMVQDTYSLREFWQHMRKVRHQRLLAAALSAKRRKQYGRLNRLKQGVRSRYVASIQLVVARGATEWGELLYLTKTQYAAIMAV